jgi:hypothetical protein
MQGEEREMNPELNCKRNVILRDEIMSPTIKIHTSRAHEIRPTSED